MIIFNSGNVGIGASNLSHRLDLNDTIHSKALKVDMNGRFDFELKKNRNCRHWNRLRSHIAEKGYFKNIPGEEEVLKNEINPGEMNAKLLQKIKKIMLYIIEIKSRI